MLMNRFSLFASTVALIILVDIATGQGPPALNGYIGGGLPPPPLEYRPPVPVQTLVPYGPQNGYEGKKLEKEFQSEQKKLEKEYGKEIEKEYKNRNGYVNGYDKDKSTPAPGVLASFSNSMSDAWNRLSTLGGSRRKRDAEDDNTNQADNSDSSAKFDSLKSTSRAMSVEGLPKSEARGFGGTGGFTSDPAVSGSGGLNGLVNPSGAKGPYKTNNFLRASSYATNGYEPGLTVNPSSYGEVEELVSKGSPGIVLDEFDQKSLNNQGFIYFKVPKKLICSN